MLRRTSQWGFLLLVLTASHLAAADDAYVKAISSFRDADSVLTTTILPGGRFIATGGYANSINLWSAGKKVSSFMNRLRTTDTTMSLSKNGSYLASLYHEKREVYVARWNVKTGEKEVLRQETPPNPIALAISPKGALVAFVLSRRITLWNVEEGTKKQTLIKGGLLPNCIQFSPDGQRVAIGATNGSVLTWDFMNEKSTKVLEKKNPGISGAVSDLEFLGNNELAIASETFKRSVKVYDLSSRKLRYEIDPGRVSELAPFVQDFRAKRTYYSKQSGLFFVHGVTNNVHILFTWKRLKDSAKYLGAKRLMGIDSGAYELSGSFFHGGGRQPALFSIAQGKRVTLFELPVPE